jgi:hypothetical protein
MKTIVPPTYASKKRLNFAEHGGFEPIVCRHIKMRTLLALACFALVAHGAPPENVAGLKFQHNDLTTLFDATGTEILLNLDGTYTGLRSFVWREASIPGGTSSGTLVSRLVDISIPPNGTWSYRVVDATTAELVLDGRAWRLRFDADKPSGRMDEPNRRFPHLFWFDPYNPTTRMVNSSARCYVAPGRSVSVGFVISEGARRLLVRAIGPGLRTFGISEPLDSLVLRVHEAGSSLPIDASLPAASRETLDTAARRVGAFPLPSANDRAKFLTLPQGAYIAEVSSADNQSAGEVLVEVYQLP